MAFFSKRKNPEQLGLELFHRFNEVIATIPLSIEGIEWHKIYANLKDVDKTQIIKELMILICVGQRIAVQICQKKKGGERTEDERIAICSALDSHTMKYLDKSPEFRNLLKQRGEQYFHLLQSHEAEIYEHGDYSNFLKELQFNFEQFCRGGGGGESDPLIIGSFSSSLPLWLLSARYWSESYMWTLSYLSENK
ncbi:MAG: hypothetical protein JW947_01890 [Sedimentisphaerales bacterium]|nr:hypothetical protein [Sedimentisphaerales bacterium]